jgi:predicted lactoylglutathione lyase
VISLVYLSNQSPSKLADDLIACGYQVWEALSVSEVLYLLQHETVNVVVVAPEVADKELVAVQQRNITILLLRKAKLQDVIWELSNLFPTGSAAVQ